MNENMTNEMELLEQKKPIVLPHPWRRFFARSIDSLIYSIIWSCIQYFVFRWHPDDNFLIALLLSYINYTLMIIIEPLLLCTWGTTPGKVIFGLTLRSRSGNKLTYSEALSRTFGVFGNGYGYGIPFYNLFRMYKCYNSSRNGETMNWDYDCDTDYYIKDLKAVRIVVYIVANIFLIAIAFIVTLQSQMPLHRGNITPIQYAENINDILTRPNTHKGVYMDDKGCWKKEYNSNKSNINDIMFTHLNPLSNHQLRVEDGIVTGVSFILENDEKNTMKFIRPYNLEIQKYYITFAFLFAQESTNCFEITDSEIKTMLERTDDFDVEFQRVRITQKIENSGYIVTHKGFWPQEGETQKFKMIFSMELIQ